MFSFVRLMFRKISQLCLGKFLRESSQTNNIAIAFLYFNLVKGFPGVSVGEKSACNAGDTAQFLGQEDLLEKEMATHSSTLAWKIPWTEEPGGLHFLVV